LLKRNNANELVLRSFSIMVVSFRKCFDKLCPAMDLFDLAAPSNASQGSLQIDALVAEEEDEPGETPPESGFGGRLADGDGEDDILGGD
jgi:hypothetical protein